MNKKIFIFIIFFLLASVLAYSYLIKHTTARIILLEGSKIYAEFGNINGNSIQCNNCSVYVLNENTREINITDGNYILILGNLTIKNDLGNKSIKIEFNVRNITGNPRFVCIGYLSGSCLQNDYDFSNLTNISINNSRICCYNETYDNDPYPETYNNNLDTNLDWKLNYVYYIGSVGNYREFILLTYIPAVLNKTIVSVDVRVYVNESFAIK